MNAHDRRYDRRSFFRASLAACAVGVVGGRTSTLLPAIPSAPVTPLPPNATRRARAAELRVALAVDARPDADSCRMGAELGIEEAARAATLLGGSITLAARARTVDDAAGIIAAGRVAVAIVAMDARATAELAARAGEHGVLLLNAFATSDALRGDRCSRMMFHVAASDAMRADAMRLWRAGGSADARSARAEVELWDPSLERFGGAQLNARFRARFAAPMDSPAWAGWLAAKVAWEASQRSRVADGPGIAAYLERDAAQFDGQKGVPLSFRRWDHQLRQPLYMVARPGRSLAHHGAEAPAEGSDVLATVPVNAASGRAALDQLGTSEASTQCRWTQ